jgi:hypothetical protein
MQRVGRMLPLKVVDVEEDARGIYPLTNDL